MNHSTNMYKIYCNPPNIHSSRVYGPKIGDMDEGIVEGCEDSRNAENELSCIPVSTVQSQKCKCGKMMQRGRIEGAASGTGG